MTTPVMTIADMRLIERKPTPVKGKYGVCAECALGYSPKACSIAILGLSQRDFGGDCQTRDVIYALEPADSPRAVKPQVDPASPRGATTPGHA